VGTEISLASSREEQLQRKPALAPRSLDSSVIPADTLPTRSRALGADADRQLAGDLMPGLGALHGAAIAREAVGAPGCRGAGPEGAWDARRTSKEQV
jgi:hypothetical protein